MIINNHDNYDPTRKLFISEFRETEQPTYVVGTQSRLHSTGRQSRFDTWYDRLYRL